jgi:hypothetical protein
MYIAEDKGPAVTHRGLLGAIIKLHAPLAIADAKVPLIVRARKDGTSR